MSTLNEYAPFLLLLLIPVFMLARSVCKTCYNRGYNAGRADERHGFAEKILNAKKEGAMTERQRLFSPSNISKQ